MDKPTVGSIVHVYLETSPSPRPYVGIVTRVWLEDYINAGVFSPDGLYVGGMASIGHESMVGKEAAVRWAWPPPDEKRPPQA